VGSTATGAVVDATGVVTTGGPGLEGVAATGIRAVGAVSAGGNTGANGVPSNTGFVGTGASTGAATGAAINVGISIVGEAGPPAVVGLAYGAGTAAGEI